MAREDISENLVHWTKGATDEMAFNILKKILLEEKLIGGTGYITGKHKCVCFTETPSNFFHEKNVRYKPFGIQFSKEQIYSEGGRPVIYQGTQELALLDKVIEWRHVTYEPVGKAIVDFTWEREWRHKTETLTVPRNATVYVKNEDYVDRLKNELQTAYESLAYRESIAIGHDWPTPGEVEFNILPID